MQRLAEGFGKVQDIIFVTAIIAVVLTIFVPLPPALLDLLLVVSIAVSVLMLLSVVYVREPARFSAFPSALLLTTVFRLAINVATTRQILGNAGRDGTGAAGRVIEAFGNFVAGAEPAIGFVIFAILVLVNFIVITKGATRISEVAARFTLDAMPGKQMAIDADLNAGLIKEAEARRRREQVAREADFYGAMDGASKFVRGDAIAGIVITLVNILAGFAVGWFKYGMPASKALYTFTILTVGDGLVSQVPALLISLGAGLMVTRSTSESSLGREFMGQVFGERKALKGAAAFLGILFLTAIFLKSGLPGPQLLLVAGLLGAVAWAVGSAAKGREQAETAKKEKETVAARKPEKVEGLLRVDPLDLEIGVGLVRLVEPPAGVGILERVARLRRQTAVDLGFVVPPVRIRDDARLEANAYVIRLRGEVIARGKVLPDRLLAMDSGSASGPLEGIEAREPAFGLAGRWIATDQKERAESLGYAVADPATVLATHLAEIIRRHAPDLLTREEVNGLIRNLKETHPSVVEEVVPDVMKPGEVQKVLQNLLREGVSIRDLGTILETLGDYAPRSRDPEVLTEYVRNALARTISLQHAGGDGRMVVITLDPRLEDLIRAAVERTDRGTSLGLTPAMISRIGERISREIGKLAAAGRSPVVLCSPTVRAAVKKVVDAVQPGVAVLSYNEILKDVKVEAVGMVAAE
jgi:flagellar biosynthesis protein FlhA